jgi:hypothetical protein
LAECDCCPSGTRVLQNPYGYGGMLRLPARSALGAGRLGQGIGGLTAELWDGGSP